MRKFFILILVLVACLFTLHAEKVRIGSLYYSLDETNHTAKVTYMSYECSDYEYDALFDFYSDDDCQYNAGWTISTANIPETISYKENTYKVTGIGESAFENCKNLRNVTIPSSVNTIGRNAFANCTSLPVVNNIRYADTYLVEVVNKSSETYAIKHGTKWIGNGAFSGCNNMRTITIPNTVKHISDGVFGGAKNLQTIYAAADHPCYRTQDGVLFNKAKNTIICYPAGKIGNTYSIPQGVTHIGSFAFDGCKDIRNIILPGTVRNMGASVFYKCENLSSITCLATNPPATDAVFFLGDATFTDVPSSVSVYVPEGSVAQYKAAKGWSRFENIRPIERPRIKKGNLYYAINTITQTAEVVRPNGADAQYYAQTTANILFTISYNGTNYSVTSIGDEAFAACTNLRSVVIPYTIKSIGDGAFFECYALSSVTLPSEVQKIGKDVFWNCNSLRSVTCKATVPPVCSSDAFLAIADKPLYVPSESLNKYKTADGWKMFKTIQAEEKPKYKVGELYYHLDSCSKTAELTRQAINEEENYAGLTKITIPSAITYGGTTYTVTCIDEYTFTACSSLESVTIPGTVQEIKTWAFTATGLKSLTLPYGLKIIGEEAFYECRNLQTVTIPASVVEIQEEAFSYCVNLGTITIPSSVRRIEKNAFACCWSMSSMNLLSPSPIKGVIDEDCGDHKHTKLYVPAASVQKYKATDGWREYESILPIKDN